MTPTPDEILDEARAAGIDWHKHWDDDGTNRLETFARAALAKWGTPTPAGEPLTPDEALDAFCKTPGIRQHVQAFVAGVRFAERHHGITKGEQHGIT